MTDHKSQRECSRQVKKTVIPSSSRLITTDKINVLNRDDPKTGRSGQDNEPMTVTAEHRILTLAVNLKHPLLAHQVEGVRWLWGLHCQGVGGILGDDMGVGKTYQICVFILSLFQNNLTKRVLVVAPSTMLDQWSKGFSENGFKPYLYHGASKEKALKCVERRGVLITSYDTLAVNVESLSRKWNYLIIDEGHLIKNPKTKRNIQLKAIPSEHRILLTGTMIQNSIEELWPLLQFCCPNVFRELSEFKKSFTKPIIAGAKLKASSMEESEYIDASTRLKKAIEPYHLRRKKEEVLTLPRKHEFTVWLRPTGSQRCLYESFMEDSYVKYSAIYHEPLPVITIQKKLCDHPVLVRMEKEAHSVSRRMDEIFDQYLLNKGHVESSKLLFLKMLLDDLCNNGHHVLIFCEMKKMLNLIEQMLKGHHKVLRIDGDSSFHDKNKTISEFQDGGAQILLLVTKVGAVGLTLTRADRVIIVDPSWNPSTDEQSVCRAYRLGQQNTVLVYRLITCGTAEEVIYRKQVYKAMLSKIVTEDEIPFSYFSDEEQKAIFQVDKDNFDVSLTQETLDNEHQCDCKISSDLEKHLSFLRQSELVVSVGHHDHLFSKTALPFKEDIRSVAKNPNDFEGVNFNRRKPTRLHTDNNKQCTEPNGSKTSYRTTVKNQDTIFQPLQMAENRAWEDSNRSNPVRAECKSLKSEVARSRSQKQSVRPTPLPENIRPVWSSRVSVSESLMVPTEKVGRLIGKNGAVIKRMQAESRAKIEFLKGDQPDASIAKIIGTPEQIMNARRLIKEEMKMLTAGNLSGPRVYSSHTPGVNTYPPRGGCSSGSSSKSDLPFFDTGQVEISRIKSGDFVRRRCGKD